MKFIYTSHAEERINERRFSKESIEKAIRKPDAVSTTRFGRKIVGKRVKN